MSKNASKCLKISLNISNFTAIFMRNYSCLKISFYYLIFSVKGVFSDFHDCLFPGITKSELPSQVLGTQALLQCNNNLNSTVRYANAICCYLDISQTFCLMQIWTKKRKP